MTGETKLMFVVFLLLLAVIGAVVCTSGCMVQPPPAAQPERPKVIIVPEPRHPDRPHEKPRLMVFTIPGCVYCTKLERDTLTDPKVKAAIAGYDVQHIDAKKSPELADKYRVTLVPFVIVEAADGSIRSRVGNLSPPDFIRWLNGAGDLPDETTWTELPRGD